MTCPIYGQVISRCADALLLSAGRLVFFQRGRPIFAFSFANAASVMLRLGFQAARWYSAAD
jgi:hypothetical protein